MGNKFIRRGSCGDSKITELDTQKDFNILKTIINKRLRHSRAEFSRYNSSKRNEVFPDKSETSKKNNDSDVGELEKSNSKKKLERSNSNRGSKRKLTDKVGENKVIYIKPKGRQHSMRKRMMSNRYLSSVGESKAVLNEENNSDIEEKKKERKSILKKDFSRRQSSHIFYTFQLSKNYDKRNNRYNLCYMDNTKNKYHVFRSILVRDENDFENIHDKVHSMLKEYRHESFSYGKGKNQGIVYSIALI